VGVITGIRQNPVGEEQAMTEHVNIRLVQRKLSTGELTRRVHFIDEVRHLEIEMAEFDEIAVRARDRWYQLHRKVQKLRADGEFSRCTAITLAGELCKVRTIKDSWLCGNHEAMLGSDMYKLLEPFRSKRYKAEQEAKQQKREGLGGIPKDQYLDALIAAFPDALA
jgi:hypothetical protein